MQHLSLIWAMSRNRLIGRGGSLPWRLPRDLSFFARTTMGKPVILGRKTFETLKSPLAGRTNIVLTRDRQYRAEGVQIAEDMESAISIAEAQCVVDGQNEIIVAGGADVYEAALPIATRLYLTLVDAQIDGDTFFPQIQIEDWRKIAVENFEADSEHSHSFSITMYER